MSSGGTIKSINKRINKEIETITELNLNGEFEDKLVVTSTKEFFTDFNGRKIYNGLPNEELYSKLIKELSAIYGELRVVILESSGYREYKRNEYKKVQIQISKILNKLECNRKLLFY